MQSVGKFRATYQSSTKFSYLMTLAAQEKSEWCSCLCLGRTGRLLILDLCVGVAFPYDPNGHHCLDLIFS